MNLTIPNSVSHILHTLNDAGFPTYTVGFCVRDAILDRTPNDWDITTAARPDQVKALFRRTVDTGIVHGTVTVLIRDESFEVTTYRVDGIYEDGRHPKQVTFTSLLSEDLRRRDFTINAMAYHPADGLIDLFGGQEDLKAGIVRAVGVPEERFQEDALRILRAIRFSAQLGFRLDPATKTAIKAFAPRLALVSPERIRVELTKLLTSDHPDLFSLIYETGLTKILLPEFDQMMRLPPTTPDYHCSVGEHTLAMLPYTPNIASLRWAALLHDIEKGNNDPQKASPHAHLRAERAREILCALRFDNATLDEVVRLIRYHDLSIALDKPNIRRAIHLVGEDLFPSLLSLMRANTLAKDPLVRDHELSDLDRLENLYREIRQDGDCLNLHSLAINGRDLIQFGIKPGPNLGQILSSLLDMVLEDPSRNTKEWLFSHLPSPVE